MLLDNHHLLLAEGQAPCESLLPGVMTEKWLETERDAIDQAAVNGGHYRAAHPILTFREARCIVDSRMPVEPPKISLL